MKLFFKEQLALFVLYFSNMFFLVIMYYFIGGFEKSENLLYFLFVSLFLLICYSVYRYFTNRRFYKKLSELSSSLETPIADIGNSCLDEALNKLLKNQFSLFQEQIHNYDRKQKEHLVFINQWVHHMKTPLSAIQLVAQENEYEPYMANIQQEIDSLNRGLNMALYMARLDSFQNDFYVETIDLRTVVTKAINELKGLFISKGIFPQILIKDKVLIQSDSKWLIFILQQLLTNAIKYSGERNKKITVQAYKQNKNIILEVKDQGVGIPKKDIKRVYEAFYTGENGRRFGESTGMGLYLVRQSCKRLQHRVELESEVDVGTIVRIIF
ncbi:sensor histidine kinase [Tepidibacter hydrothermalis]|uniref:histidine kinase n=1 Tax=Tepidibacter hydrothermalis TaxID=3036126 RepID=A0ABY8EA15_9FIRM|nr:sensor histidine kinase [Tepidibacter hydrothermalis]WFD08654.1 sensor histidine kinase [Tepidibacter hydrothermalis]